MQRKFVLTLFVSVFTLFIQTRSSAQTVTITLDYAGAQALGCCSVCTGDYFCFGGSCGCCTTNGNLNFTDPVPPGNTITGVSVNFFGVDCGSGAFTIPTSINGSSVGSAPVSTTDCSCGGCYQHIANATFPCTGLPGYNYGGINTLQPSPGQTVCMDRAEITFTYVPTSSFALPAIGTISGPASGCSGDPGTYTIPVVTGATTYTWTVPGGTTIVSGQGTTSINITNGSTSGNICVTASSACDTEGPTCYPVDFSGPTVNDPADQTVCAGSNTAPVIFAGTGTPTFNWTNSNPAIGLGASGTGDIPSFVATNGTGAAISGTITVTPVTACTGTPQTFIITVNPTPSMTDPADQTICANALTTTTTFTGSVGGTTFAWTNSNTGIGLGAGGSGNIGAFNGLNAGIAPVTATVTVTPSLGTCAGVAETFTYTINPSPSFTLSSTNPTTCSGTDGTITISGLNASTSYDVTYTDGAVVGPATMTSDGTGTITITGLNAGLYSNFIVGLAGCDGTSASALTLVDPTAPTVGAGTDFSICAGSSATLTASNPDGASLSWDNGVTDGVSFTPAATTTYTVTATASGCSTTDQVVITVNPLPVIGAGTDQAICTGSPVTLTANNPNGASLSWDNGVTDGVAFAPAATTTYTVTGTLLGCVSTDQVVVTVNSLPTVTASASPGTDLCIGEMVTLNGAGATTYTWDNGVTNGVAFAATVTTTYTVTGSDINGCQNTASITLNVVNCAPPIAQIGTSGSPSTICVNDCINFQDLSTGTNIDTWFWDLGAGGMTSTVQNPATMCYGVTGTYTISLTVTDDNGTDTETFTLTVIDCIPPTAVFTLSDTSICLGECVTLTNMSTQNPTSWAWDFDGAADPNTSTESSPTLCPTTTGTFDIELTVTNPYGTNTITHSLTVNEIPLVSAGLDTIIDMNTSAELIAIVSPAGGAYQWLEEDHVECPTCPATFVTPVYDEQFQLIYISPAGCTASDSVNVFVLFEDLINVPNGFSPNGDNNNDVVFVKGDGIVDMHFIIYNRYGQKVFESFDQKIGWDGYLNGRPENPGVFVWYLEYTLVDGSSNSKKGNLTLIK